MTGPFGKSISAGTASTATSSATRPAAKIHLFGDEEYALADSFALADDLTFERSNPSSVYSCFAQGRENARHTRHCISPEVWTCLNTAYLRLQQQNIATVWRWEPTAWYQAVATDIETFGGLAETTMYHDDRWSFLQLGRYVERAQGAAALLLAQIDTTTASASQEFYEEDWTSLLRVFFALEVYNLTYSVSVLPDRVAGPAGQRPPAARISGPHRQAHRVRNRRHRQRPLLPLRPRPATLRRPPRRHD